MIKMKNSSNKQLNQKIVSTEISQEDINIDNKHYVILSILIAILVATLLVMVAVGLLWWPFNIVKTSKSTVIAPPAKLQPLKIVAVGDIACDPTSPKANGLDPVECQDKKVRELVNSINPDKILILGDIAYDKGTTESFTNGFYKTWGDIKTKFLPAPGNHEYGTKNAAGYFNYFGSQAGEGLAGYYTTKIGDWSIYSLNSNCPETNDCSVNSTQINWLKSQLQNDTNKCQLAFWHHPQFSTSKHSVDPAQTNRLPSAWQLLQNSNAELVLNGHEHNYEKFAQQLLDGTKSDDGIREFVVGTGGRSLYQQVRQNANSEYFYSGFGALELELYPSSYSWKFYNIDNKILDSGVGICKR